MKMKIAFVTLAAGLLAFAAANAQDDEASKFDPNKPLQPPVESQANEGKSDVEIAGDDTGNSIDPEDDVKMRAGPWACDLHVNNQTSFYIHRLYVNGILMGAVGRHGSHLIRNVPIPTASAYAEVDFIDGPTLSYGPIVFNCNSYATFRWNLR